ncbi:MAG: hypothetical protein ACREF6_14235 [Alphaproteobacteria bacterium]
MPTKTNPLKLNSLQLKALTIMQAYAETPNAAQEGDSGEVTINMPPPHGDHFHVGHAVVMLKDATGLVNEGVWAALQRKGLIRPLMFPTVCTLTALGLTYDTGLGGAILHRAHH